MYFLKTTRKTLLTRNLNKDTIAKYDESGGLDLSNASDLKYKKREGA